MNKVGMAAAQRSNFPLTSLSLRKDSSPATFSSESFQPNGEPPPPRWKQSLAMATGATGAVLGASTLAFGGAMAATCLGHGTEPVIQMLSHPSTISAMSLPAGGPIALGAVLISSVIGLKGGFDLGSRLGNALGVAGSAVMGIPGYVLKLLQGKKPESAPPTVPAPAPPQPGSQLARPFGLLGLVSGSLGGTAAALSAASHVQHVSALLSGAVPGPAGPALALAAAAGALAMGALGAVGGWELGKKVSQSLS